MSIKIKTIQNFETYCHNDPKVQIEVGDGGVVRVEPSLQYLRVSDHEKQHIDIHITIL